MPAFVRTEKDEARWADAKKQARGEGKGENYAYITTIYNQMKKSYSPSASQSPYRLGIGTPFSHGEVPKITVITKPSIAADIDPHNMPTPKTALELKLPLGPFNSAKDAVHGMGMPLHTEHSWASAFETAVKQSDNELRFKQNLMGKLLENFANDGVLRREMYQRGLAYYRTVSGPKEKSILILKAKKKESSPLGSRGLTRESRESSSRGGHKLELHGRRDPVLEVQQQTNRALPAGSVRVHYSAEHKGYVEAMKRADGTWKVIGDAHGKREKKPDEEHDHSKPKLVVHHDEHQSGSHEPHHHAEDDHNEARNHILAMKALRKAERKGPFADEKNKKYPLDDYEHTRAAISYFSMPKNAKKYIPPERAVIWNKIKAAAKKFKIDLGPKAGPPSLEAKKSNQSKETEMEQNEVFKAILDRDVEITRPNDYQSEFTGMPEEALSEAKTEQINPDATAAGAEEGDPETESPLTPAQGSGDGEGLGGATDDNGGLTTSKGAETNAWGTVAKGDSHPNHLQPVRVTKENGTWNQGEGSRVTYSNNEDAFIAAAMEKSDNLCIAPEPSVRYSAVMGTRKTSCGHQFAKALTVCPTCGTDASGFSGQIQGLSISKAVQSRLEAPMELADIRLAD